MIYLCKHLVLTTHSACVAVQIFCWIFRDRSQNTKKEKIMTKIMIHLYSTHFCQDPGFPSLLPSPATR